MIQQLIAFRELECFSYGKIFQTADVQHSRGILQLPSDYAGSLSHSASKGLGCIEHEHCQLMQMDKTIGWLAQPWVDQLQKCLAQNQV